MKILVAGATGGLGRSLLPKLVAAGHEVTGMVRSGSSAAAVRAQGADVVVADGLDAAAVKAAVTSVQPEVVVQPDDSAQGRDRLQAVRRGFAMRPGRPEWLWATQA
jgi:uncharacterized protein YbjT (DUF2867 family)